MRIILLMCTLAMLSADAHAKIYIDINKSSTRSFPLAIDAPVVLSAGVDVDTFSKTFLDTLKRDLRVMGVFKLLSQTAFLEPLSQRKKVKASQINFGHWKTIEAQALIKGLIKKTNDVFTVEMYLHDVPFQKQIIAKRFSGQADQARDMAHRFANAVVQALIGEQGAFDTQLAFVCRPKKDKELCMMHFNGWNYRKITDHKTAVLSPEWDPITNSIYYTAFNKKGASQLYLYQIDRQKILNLTNLEGTVIGLSFDPVSKNIITSISKRGNTDIHMLNRYGQLQKKLTSHRKIDVSATFSPDGDHMAFVSDRDGSPQIYKMHLSTQKITRLTFKGRNNASPAWSPSGDKIAFAGMDTDGNYDIFVIDTDGSHLKRLTYDTQNNEDPTWAPEGNFIAFTSSRTGNNQIFMMRPNGKMQTQLTFKPWDHSMPTWERK